MAEETLPVKPEMDEEFEEEGPELTILEHLDELRRRMIAIAISMVIATAVGLVIAPRIFQLLISLAGQDFSPIFIEMTEMFVTYFKVSVFIGAGIAMPIIVWHIVRFVAPGLTRKERRLLLSMLPLVTVFFVAGILFGYFITLPFSVKYLLFQFPDAVGLNIRPEIRIENYISFVTTVLFWMGISFQTPLIVFMLVQLGVVSRQRLQSFRKFAILVAFVVSAIVTPTPDPLNQSLVAIPLIVLYELGIQLSRFARSGDYSGGHKH